MNQEEASQPRHTNGHAEFDTQWDELILRSPAYRRLDRWLDKRLAKLEARWAHMSTVNSRRRALTSHRG